MPEPAALYQTIDGGVSWRLIADDGNDIYAIKAYSPIDTGITGRYHTGMVFESPTDGWMAISSLDDGGGTLLHTIDGGHTWHPVTMMSASTTVTPITVTALVNCELFDLRLEAPGVLTLGAYCLDDNLVKTGFLYQTTNDGVTWQVNSLPANFINNYGAFQLYMMSATDGLAVGCDSPARVPDPKDCATVTPLPLAFYRTTDSGQTWTRSGPLPDVLRPAVSNASNATYAQFDFIDDHTGWAIDPTGKLLITVDGGKIWTPLNVKIENVGT